MIDMIEHHFRAALADVTFGDWKLLITRDYLQWGFDGACAHTGRRGAFKGRKWRLSPHMTKSELVQTALMAALAAVEHEARERFLYRGQAIFGPHYDIDALALLCEDGATDERKVAT